MGPYLCGVKATRFCSIFCHPLSPSASPWASAETMIAAMLFTVNFPPFISVQSFPSSCTLCSFLGCYLNFIYKTPMVFPAFYFLQYCPSELLPLVLFCCVLLYALHIWSSFWFISWSNCIIPMPSSFKVLSFVLFSVHLILSVLL